MAKHFFIYSSFNCIFCWICWLPLNWLSSLLYSAVVSLNFTDNLAEFFFSSISKFFCEFSYFYNSYFSLLNESINSFCFFNYYLKLFSCMTRSALIASSLASCSLLIICAFSITFFSIKVLNLCNYFS